MLRAATLIVMLVAAAGCAAPVAPSATPASVAPRKPAETAQPLVASGTVDGLLPGNPGGARDNSPGWMVSNNAGAFEGRIRMPKAALVASYAAPLLAGDFRGLLAASPAPSAAPMDALEPAPAGTEVMVLEAADGYGIIEGGRVDQAPTKVGADGTFAFNVLPPCGPLVVVRAIVPVAGHALTLDALVPAPRTAGLQRVDIDPASTLLARKLLSTFKARGVRLSRLPADPPVLAELAAEVGRASGEAALVAGPLLPQAQAVLAFDMVVERSPALRAAVDKAAVALIGLD